MSGSLGPQRGLYRVEEKATTTPTRESSSSFLPLPRYRHEEWGWAAAFRLNMKMPEQHISDLDAMKVIGAVMTLKLDPIQAWLLLCYLQAAYHC